MPRKDSFSRFHPTVNFLYFTLVIGCGMVFWHPLTLTVSLLSAAAYAISLEGRKAVRFAFCYMLPLLLLTALAGPAFSHAGATILTYLPSGNPLTLESIAHGAAAAAMLIGMILWFRCYSAVMTADKFMYLFGRVIPALSLVLSMTLRFIPKCTAQLHTVKDAQRGLGRETANGSVWQRVRGAVGIFSIMLTWALENAVETADSMKSRGYGLRGRTAFSVYRFEKRDKAALCWLLLCGGAIVGGALAGGFHFRYFPTMNSTAPLPLFVTLLLLYAALCLTPLILDRKEARTWQRLRSEI